METVAVFSRISECDLPFYSQWLEYYTKIGVDKFYIIGDPLYGSLPFLKDYNVSFYPCKHYDDEKEKMSFFTDVVKTHIQEDYVLMIDADEYLAYTNIKEIIEDKRDLYFFSWFMIPSLFTEYKNMHEQSVHIKGFNLNQGKSLYRVSRIETVFNYHHFNGPYHMRENLNNSLYHFRFRGIKDIINKCCTSSGYTEWHKKDSEKLKEFLSNDRMKLENIPNRIILAAAEYYCQNKREQKKLPIDSNNNTDDSLFRYAVDTDIFKARFELFLTNTSSIFKEFEFGVYCKASLITFLKHHNSKEV